MGLGSVSKAGFLPTFPRLSGPFETEPNSVRTVSLRSKNAGLVKYMGRLKKGIIEYVRNLKGFSCIDRHNYFLLA